MCKQLMSRSNESVYNGKWGDKLRKNELFYFLVQDLTALLIGDTACKYSLWEAIDSVTNLSMLMSCLLIFFFYTVTYQR